MEACMTRPDGEAVRALFDGAMAAGGEDNISILAISISNEEVEAKAVGESGHDKVDMAR
jgi:hypothetical protein